MRKILFCLLLAGVFVLFYSCKTPREVVWDLMVYPFAGLNKDKLASIDGCMPSCDFAQFDFNLAYTDSLSRSENYILSFGTSKNETFSLLQTRMYDRQGLYAGSYELCIGNAKHLGIYETVPIGSNISHFEILNREISLCNDLNFLMADDTIKDGLLSQTTRYDYTIVTIWSPFVGYYAKRHLRELKRYVRQFGDDYTFRVLYVRLPLEVKM